MTNYNYSETKNDDDDGENNSYFDTSRDDITTLRWHATHCHKHFVPNQTNKYDNTHLLHKGKDHFTADLLFYWGLNQPNK